MKTLCVTVIAGMLALAPAIAQHEGHGMNMHGQTAQATTVAFRVAAIHCQACVTALEGKLVKVAGVKSATASYQGKTAVVAYDPGKTDVGALAQVIAQTPSPMPRMHFEPVLLLMAHGVKDAKAAGQLSAALKDVKGVQKADVDAAKGIASVTLAAKPAVRLADLAAAAKKAGFMVMPLPADKAAASNEGGMNM